MSVSTRICERRVTKIGGELTVKSTTASSLRSGASALGVPSCPPRAVFCWLTVSFVTVPSFLSASRSAGNFSASTRPRIVPIEVPSFWRVILESTTWPPASLISFWALA